MDNNSDYGNDVYSNNDCDGNSNDDDDDDDNLLDWYSDKTNGSSDKNLHDKNNSTLQQLNCYHDTTCSVVSDNDNNYNELVSLFQAIRTQEPLDIVPVVEKILCCYPNVINEGGEGQLDDDEVGTMFRLLLDIDSIQQRDEYGHNLLHRACFYYCTRSDVNDTFEIIQYLTTTNPELVYQIDNDNNLPLHIACRYDESGLILRFLLEIYPESIELCDKNGNNPLHLVCLSNRSDERNTVDIIQYLVQRNPKLTEQTNYYKLYPLHLALLNTKSDTIIQLLISACPSVVDYPMPVNNYIPWQDKLYPDNSSEDDIIKDLVNAFQEDNIYHTEYTNAHCLEKVLFTFRRFGYDSIAKIVQSYLYTEIKEDPPETIAGTYYSYAVNISVEKELFRRHYQIDIGYNVIKKNRYSRQPNKY